MPFFEQHKSLFRNPKKLADVVASLNADSEYAAIFVPGGHGALIGFTRKPGRSCCFAVGNQK